MGSLEGLTPMTNVIRMSLPILAVVSILALVLAVALLAADDAGAAETDGTLDVCVSQFTGAFRLVDGPADCSANETAYVIEGQLFVAEPSDEPRPTATEGEPEPEPTATEEDPPSR